MEIDFLGGKRVAFNAYGANILYLCANANLHLYFFGLCARLTLQKAKEDL